MRRLLRIAMPSCLARAIRRRFAATLLVALVALAGSVAAWAYWTTVGAGTGAGSVGTLNPPTGVSASSVSGSGTASVSWTASASGGAAVAPQGYFVTRTNGTTTAAACGTSPGSLTTGTGCSDSGVPDGTYTYTVTAVYHSWTAAGAPSSAVTVSNDVTPPTGTITFPGGSAALNGAGWTAGCGTPSTNDICGTASDASGVQQVQVSILQVSSGKYWNGTGFSSTSEAFQTAALSSPNATSTGWSYPLALPAPDGGYTLHMVARDVYGNAPSSGTYTATAGFTIDTVQPTATSITTSGANPTNTGPLSFTVTFSEPVRNVTAANFSLTTSGVGGTAPTISGVSPSSGLNTSYTVTVSTAGATGTNSGSIRLDLSSIGTIQDAATNLLSATRTGDQSFTYDTTSSTLTTLQMFDTNANGKVDQVKATFNETLASSTATAPWTLSNVPSGGALASVSTSGNVATLTLTEGAGAPNTAVGSFTVALAASTSGIRDLAGNQSSFAATAPADKAGPVPIAIASTNGGSTGGKAEAGDTITVTFSEPLAALGTTTSTVTLSTSNGSGKAVNLNITNLSSAAFQIGTKNRYLTGTGGTSATFTSSTLSEPTSSQVRVTLGTWDGNGSLSVGSFVSGDTTPFLPATGIVDPAGNPAAGSLVIAIAFF